MPCKNVERCPMPLEEGVGPIFKKHYCMNNWDNCARFQVMSTVGGAHVPRTLLPNMNDEARAIIFRAKGEDTSG